jgi:hypothetical protein
LTVLALWSLAGAASCAAQGEVPRELLLLSRIKQRMAQNLSRMPDYTCLETIERSRSVPRTKAFKLVDTLRLEVAHVGNKELYSWPGAQRFEDRDAGEIVGAGLISSGDFALHAQSVFVGTAPMFTYRGEEDLQGRRALRYDYRIPYMWSGYRLRVAGSEGKVGSSGSFWADAETLDLIRLEVHADEIPPDLPVASAVTQIDYGRVRIGASDVLLPQRAEVVMTDTAGEQMRNRIEFTHCRQYQSEVVLSFEPEKAPSTVTAAPARQITEIKLPADLPVPVELAAPIDSEHALVGDLVTARVRADVKQDGRVVVPRDARLTGRIRRLEKYPTPVEHFIVALEFRELTFADKRARFLGELEEIGPLAGLSRKLSLPSTRTQSVWRDKVGTATTRESLTTEELPGVGTFYMRGSRFRLPPGLRMVWKTKDLKR